MRVRAEQKNGDCDAVPGEDGRRPGQPGTSGMNPERNCRKARRAQQAVQEEALEGSHGRTGRVILSAQVQAQPEGPRSDTCKPRSSEDSHWKATTEGGRQSQPGEVAMLGDDDCSWGRSSA